MEITIKEAFDDINFVMAYMGINNKENTLQTIRSEMIERIIIFKPVVPLFIYKFIASAAFNNSITNI